MSANPQKNGKKGFAAAAGIIDKKSRRRYNQFITNVRFREALE
ncbi:MAG: hypothetical protein ACTHKA_02060 [Anaerocolumna jejuensis]